MPVTRRRLGRVLATAFSATTFFACAPAMVSSRPPEARVLIPAGDPRIVLERVIRPEPRGRSTLGRILGIEGGTPGQQVLLQPYGLAWAGDSLLVADPEAGAVLRIEPDGKVSRTAEGDVRAPAAVAVCPQGILVASPGDGRVAVLGPDLRRIRWLAEGLERPSAVACAEARVFVAETGRHRILGYGADGESVPVGRRGSGPAEFNFPTALVATGSELFVGDTLNFRVQRLDTTTLRPFAIFGSLGDAPGDMPRLKGLALDAQGHLWVSDGLLDRVSIYDPDGVLLVSFGGSGDAPGRFSFPAGLSAHPDGRVAVADSRNRRIQVFRLLQRQPERP